MPDLVRGDPVLGPGDGLRAARHGEHEGAVGGLPLVLLAVLGHHHVRVLERLGTVGDYAT